MQKQNFRPITVELKANRIDLEMARPIKFFLFIYPLIILIHNNSNNNNDEKLKKKEPGKHEKCNAISILYQTLHHL